VLEHLPVNVVDESEGEDSNPRARIFLSSGQHPGEEYELILKMYVFSS
jgi:hypothetical protein